jgi:DNA-directed RNA polymerase I subunit RPA2
VASHHVESFNYAMDTCLPRINQYMLTAEIAKPPPATVEVMARRTLPTQEPNYPFQKMNIWFEDIELKTPSRTGGSFQAASVVLDGDQKSHSEADKLYPYECRLRSLTYAAPLYATVARKFDNEPEEKATICLGEVPVMVNSKFCNLAGMTEEELTRHKEDCFEFGGYYIINGNERITRMLIMNKRNYPIAF